MEQAGDDRTESKILLLADDHPANITSSESHNSDPKPTTRGGLPLILYKNYWFLPHHAANIMMLHRDDSFFKARHGDTILASNPKCGTTWLKALAFTITTRSRYSFVDHPLLTRHPQELVPYIEIPLTLAANDSIDDDDTVVASSPARSRLLATHMPFSLLPESIVADDHGCRIVYICREPKDAFVAGWHFANIHSCTCWQACNVQENKLWQIRQ